MLVDKRTIRNYAVGIPCGIAMVALFATPRVIDGGWSTFEIAIDLLCVVLFSRAIAGFVDTWERKREDRMIDLYDDQCDPGAFVAQAGPYIKKFSKPYDEHSIWFLTPYAQALVDVGDEAEARRIADEMFSSVEHIRSARERASALINMEPIVTRLFGLQRALGLLEAAQGLLDEEPVAADFGRREYVKWRRGLLSASLEGNDVKLLESLREIRLRDTCSWRLRVMCAIDEAAVYYRRQDTSRERDCLEFVIEHGNELPCVNTAAARLAQLEP